MHKMSKSCGDDLELITSESTSENTSDSISESALWRYNLSYIFYCDYDDIEQEHCGDGATYYNATLLRDFGPFKKGHECTIEIDSQTGGNFIMRIGDEEFAPVWKHIKKYEDALEIMH